MASMFSFVALPLGTAPGSVSMVRVCDATASPEKYKMRNYYDFLRKNYVELIVITIAR